MQKTYGAIHYLTDDTMSVQVQYLDGKSTTIHSLSSVIQAFLAEVRAENAALAMAGVPLTMRSPHWSVRGVGLEAAVDLVWNAERFDIPSAGWADVLKSLKNLGYMEK